jgi:hypothetical protein
MIERVLAVARRLAHRQGRAGLLAASGLLVFALVGIGGPLVGAGRFSASEQLQYRPPWAEELSPPPFDGQSPLNDTYEQVHPAIDEWATRLRHGDLALTSPYEHGGTMLTAWTVDGFLDPMNLPWIVLPAAWAPGYVKLLEILVAGGFTYLFCRRLGVRPAPAWIGGLAYAASGFQIAWTNWPHSRVGAITPAIFWAAERLVQSRRWRDVAVLAVMVAWSLAAGFPSVTVMALVAAAAYLVFRLVQIDRTDWRRLVAGGAMAALAVLLGAGVMAVQLSGLQHALSRSDLSNRDAFFGVHAPAAELATAILPAGLGLPEWGGWARPRNIVEAQTFVGGAIALLALGIVVRRRPAHQQRGVAIAFVALVVVSLELIFVGGPPLELVQRLVPPLSTSSFGRWRSVLGFGTAVLAALGADRWASAGGRRTGGARRWSYVAAGALALATVAFVVAAVSPVPAVNRPGLRVDVVVLLCSLAATLAVLRLAARRPWAIGLVVAGVLLEALVLVLPYWHRSPDRLWYPSSPLVTAAAQVQGHDRVEGVDAVGRGVTSAYGLRTATGYSPAATDWAELVTAVTGQARTEWATEMTTLDQAVQGSNLLDRLGVRYLLVGAPVEVDPLPQGWSVVARSPGGVLVERPGALARIRWASTSTVVPHDQQVARLAAGVPADQVLLDRPSSDPEGGDGRIVSISERDSDVKRIEVEAGGAGYVVVADSFDSWWHVTVDGRSVDPLRADHAMIAVPVGAGHHEVTLRYALPAVPIAVSAASLLALVGLVSVDLIRSRRRRTG